MRRAQDMRAQVRATLSFRRRLDCNGVQPASVHVHMGR